MKIIVIEGLDKSGKHTQSKLLKKFLESLGYTVIQSEFHRYDTPTGKLIQQWLYKEWDVDDLTIELIMSADKQAKQRWFTQLEERGVDFLILDRYSASQICYSRTKGIDEEWVFQLQKNFRKPDMEIFIDISPQESMRRKGKHGDNDRYESDLELLRGVRKEYINYFEKSTDRFSLLNSDLLSKEELSKNINKLVTEKFDVAMTKS